MSELVPSKGSLHSESTKGLPKSNSVNRDSHDSPQLGDKKKRPTTKKSGKKTTSTIGDEISYNSSDNGQVARIEDMKGFDEGFRSKFAPYKDIINNLTKIQHVDTDEDIIHISISHDSSVLLIVLVVDDEHCIIKQFCTDKIQIMFHHDLKGEYIKAKEVIQNSDASLFCCPYFDNGTFRLLVFDKDRVHRDFNINQAIKMDTKTRPNDNFQEPMMSACFVENDTIFVNIFHSKDLQMHHFIYSVSDNLIVGGSSKVVMT